VIITDTAGTTEIEAEKADEKADVTFSPNIKDGVLSLDNGKNVATITVTAEDGTIQDYTVYIHVVEIGETDQYLPETGLPIIKIDTAGRPIDSTDIWLKDVVYTVVGNNTKESGYMDIKGRGNTTWGMPKKPYSIKLSNKVSMLGMPAHKRWALLANYADKTLLRNDVAFKIGSIFDNLAWTSKSVHVVVYINNEYQGIYQLTEQIKIDENRVAIDKTISKKKNPDGGYILEIDVRQGEEFNFTTAKGVVFCCSDPDEDLDEFFDPSTGLSGSIFEKIKNDVQHVEDVIYSDSFADPDTGYRKYIDVDSFVDWYLANEITKNNDAVFFSSVYMYYDPVKLKYCMGPIWDFDISMGNINYNGNDNPQGFWIKESPWISRLFEDPSFVSLIKSRWNAKKQEIISLQEYIEYKAEYLHDAQFNNFKRWDILNVYVWPNAVIPGSYPGEINYLKTWLNKRIDWLNLAINSL
jgi:spore coat protein CotH